MENTPDAPCSGQKTSLAVVAAVLLIAIVAAAAAIFVFDPFKPELPLYAPEGTNNITYINGGKISRNKVFKAWQKTLTYKNMAEEAQKSGIDLDKAFLGEACIFGNNGGLDNSSGIYRDRNGQAKQLQLLFSNNQAAVEELRSVTTTLLNSNTVAFAGKGAACPTKGKANALTRAIDKNALVSCVSKVELTESHKKALETEQIKPFRDIALELDMLYAALLESENDLELKLEGEYKSAEAAKKAYESLIAARKLGETLSQGEENKEAADVLRKIEISVKDNRITITLKYPMDKLVEFIEKLDKAEREQKDQATGGPEKQTGPAPAPERK